MENVFLMQWFLISRDYCIIKYKPLIDFISVTHFYFLFYWEKMGSTKACKTT